MPFIIFPLLFIKYSLLNKVSAPFVPKRILLCISEDSFVEIIVEQDYLNTSVMIYDNGIGIFKKIKEHFKFPSLDEAICELFKGKLTTDSENHSGEGIFFSSKMMDDFFIVSSGKIFTNNR